MWTQRRLVTVLLSIVVVLVSLRETSSSYMCSRRWRLVLEHDVNGNAIYGTKLALRQATIEGAPVRVYVDTPAGTGLVVSDDMISFINNDICIESLMHIARSSWNKFLNDSIWQFLQICSTGDMQTLNWQFGNSTQNTERRDHVGASWFVQYNGCKEGEGNVLLRTMPNGTSVGGDIMGLITAAKDGADFIVYDDVEHKMLPMKSLTWSYGDSLFIGENQWSLTDHHVGNHIAIDTWPTWMFSLWSTNGAHRVASWNLRTNNITLSNRTADVKWFQDPCWQLAYSHNYNGVELDGSLDYLRSAASKGHRIKIVMGNFSTEADDILLENGHVTAIFTGDISRNVPAADLHWIFRIISTTGISKLYRFNILSPYIHGFELETTMVSWFFDARPWKNVLSTNENGDVIRGSKQELQHAVRSGAVLRYAWRSSHSWTTVQRADSIIINGTEISAESIRSLFVTKDPRDGFLLPYHPYWSFSLSTTQGDVDISRWTVGQHENRGHQSIKTAIDWFVNN